jgi:hypothetical protein
MLPPRRRSLIRPLLPQLRGLRRLRCPLAPRSLLGTPLGLQAQRRLVTARWCLLLRRAASSLLPQRPLTLPAQSALRLRPLLLLPRRLPLGWSLRH